MRYIEMSALSHLSLASVTNLPVRSRTAPNIDADEHLVGLGLDDFLAEKLRALRGSGHWARTTAFGSTGNRSAVLQYVPTAGEMPETVFGPNDLGNTVSLQIWACHDGSVRIEVYSRQQRIAQTKVPHKAVTRESLEQAYSAFVRLAIRFAQKNAIRH